MSSEQTAELEWIVLTTGNRPEQLDRAILSVAGRHVVVVVNAGSEVDVAVDAASRVERPGENLGVPGGRDRGVEASNAPIVGFLDDDAEFRGDVERIEAAFAADPQLGAVSLRLVDEHGETQRRHVPRVGGGRADETGQVALFLGGACALRRRAYEEVGGYYTELRYGHEELELAWRLVDAGWTIRYLSEIEVYHPRTPIDRHPDGWELTGRNRVLIARRTLPLPVAAVHVVSWLAVGARRAPRGEHRRAYLRGWRSGWSAPVERRPISWRGVWRLARLGRPPVV